MANPNEKGEQCCSPLPFAVRPIQGIFTMAKTLCSLDAASSQWLTEAVNLKMLRDQKRVPTSIPKIRGSFT